MDLRGLRNNGLLSENPSCAQIPYGGLTAKGLQYSHEGVQLQTRPVLGNITNNAEVYFAFL